MIAFQKLLLRAAMLLLTIGTAAAQSSYDPVDDVLYQIMPIAWRDSDNDPNRFGDFGGMTASLPYLEQLGVTGVWMTPIFPSPAYHGYQHGAADALNPRFGTIKDFTDFIAAAHARKIRVYIDFVAYGISHDSEYFRSAYNNPGSPYSSWLAFEDSANATYTGYRYKTWDGTEVGFIHWNLGESGPVNLTAAWGQLWLDPNRDGDPRDGVDGFRLDHAYADAPEGWGATIDYWKRWKRSLQRTRPDVFTFAEQGDWSSYGSDLLPAHDAAFTKPFEFAARAALSGENASGLYSSMAATLAALPGGAPSAGRTFLCTIGDHDVGRLVSAIGAEGANAGRAKAAAAVLLLQPLPPVLYYGDELGMRGLKQSYGSDADDIPMREPMKWNRVAGDPMSDYWRLHPPSVNGRYSRDNDGRSVEEQTGVAGSVLETYRTLIALRRASSALRRGMYAAAPAAAPQVWSFVRHYAPVGGTRQTLVVAINLSGQDQQTTLDFSHGFSIAASGVTPRDYFTGAALPRLNFSNIAAYPLNVPAYDFRILSADITPPTPPQTKVDGREIPMHLGTAADPAGETLSVQTRPTINNNVIELDQLAVRVASDGLYVGMTGNLPSDGSALALFVDTGVPGQNVLNTSSLTPPPAGLQWLTQTQFDAGFSPRFLYYINGSNGNVYVDRVLLQPNGSASKTYLGQNVQNSGTGVLAGGSNLSGVQVAMDNTNILGVTSTSAAGATSATTGFEVFLPYTSLGMSVPVPPCTRIGLFGAIVFSGGDFTDQGLPACPTKSTYLGFFPFFPAISGQQHLFFTIRGPADIDGDGVVTLDDFQAFVRAFEAGYSIADLTADGFLTFEDFDRFIAAFEGGC